MDHTPFSRSFSPQGRDRAPAHGAAPCAGETRPCGAPPAKRIPFCASKQAEAAEGIIIKAIRAKVRGAKATHIGDYLGLLVWVGSPGLGSNSLKDSRDGLIQLFL